MPKDHKINVEKIMQKMNKLFTEEMFKNGFIKIEALEINSVDESLVKYKNLSDLDSIDDDAIINFAELPLPEGETIKCMILSDVHGHWDINALILSAEKEKVEIIFYAGDIVNHDYDLDGQVNKSVDAIKKLGEKTTTIIIGGNHDTWLKNLSQFDRKALFYPAIYLENEIYKYKGLKFFGTPYTPAQFDKHLKDSHCKFYNPKTLDPFGNLKDDVDVIITHGGPQGMQTHKNVQYGSESLRKLIITSKNLQACFFGHMHSNSGCRILNNVICVNASQMEGSEYIHRPVYLTLNLDKKCIV